MLLYIIRHGDPIYNPDTLTELGKKQADALAKRLAVHGLDRIFSSPNGRARETAQPTCDLFHIEPEIEPWTSENLTWAEYAAEFENSRYGWTFHVQNNILKSEENMKLTADDWYTADCFKKIDGKTAYERMKRDSDAFLEKLGYRREGAVYRVVEPNEQRVAVFCHQGFGVTWLSHLLAIPPHIFWASFDLTHSSITVLQFQNNPDGLTAPLCLTLSDTSHLYKDDLPLKYNNRIEF